MYVPDFQKETRYQPWGKKTSSELAVPLMVRDEIVGVLDCQSENPDHFDSETVDLLTLFSTQASMALQNARCIRWNGGGPRNWKQLILSPAKQPLFWT